MELVHVLTFRLIDAKFFGVLAMFGAIVVMLFTPWLDTSTICSGRYRPRFCWWFRLLVADFLLLMWCGAQFPTLLLAAEGGTAIPDIPFSFDGPFGTYDPQQLQRGLQAYSEICSA